jgi:hypothetical protein
MMGDMNYEVSAKRGLVRLTTRAARGFDSLNDTYNSVARLNPILITKVPPATKAPQKVAHFHPEFH